MAAELKPEPWLIYVSAKKGRKVIHGRVIGWMHESGIKPIPVTRGGVLQGYTTHFHDNPVSARDHAATLR